MRNLQESNYKARHNHNHIRAWLPDHGGEMCACFSLSQLR